MADSPGILTWMQQLVQAVNNIGNQFKAAVTGPGAAVSGDLASWSGTGGTVLSDSGVTASSVAGLGSLTDRTKGSSLVGYLGTGTGATGRTAQSKFDDYVSVKDFGAKGDGVTDDSAAIQNALNVNAAVYFPTGTYFVNTALTITINSKKIFGDGADQSILKASVNNIPLLTINNVSRVSISSMGFTQGDFIYTAANALLTLNNSGEAKLTDIQVSGGFYCLRLSGTNTTDNIISQSKFLNSYGGGQILSQGTVGGIYFRRVKIDQNWPAGSPVAANDKGARLNSTAYVVGDVVQLSGYNIQCTVAGTSAAAAPALQPYNVNIIDGTVTWRLANIVGSAAVIIDTGSFQILFEECDMTGPYDVGLSIKNSLAGTAPNRILVRHTEISGMNNIGIDCEVAASMITVDTCTIHSPSGLAGSFGGTIKRGVNLGGTFLGDLNVINTYIWGFSAGQGIEIESGSNFLVSGCNIGGCNIGIQIGTAGLIKFSFTGNLVGSSPTNGANTTAIKVVAGASDHYIIANNVVNGATTGISDGGTGVNKFVGNNF